MKLREEREREKVKKARPRLCSLPSLTMKTKKQKKLQTSNSRRDLPQALQEEYQGWLSPKSVADFEAYASLVFERLGKRVKHWSTFNEPYTFAVSFFLFFSFGVGRAAKNPKKKNSPFSKPFKKYSVLRSRHRHPRPRTLLRQEELRGRRGLGC